MLNKIHITPLKIYRHFEDKYFAFGLSRESASMDVFKARMIFKRHYIIHHAHSTTNKMFGA